MVGASRNAIIRRVQATDGGLHVTYCPGDEPALVLMHGSPVTVGSTMGSSRCCPAWAAAETV